MEFNRIIKLLRKERGITQKQAAEDLGVSQALLSHYEKGIRECGLDFVVRVADYYNVSCDYLLGRSAERNGMMLVRRGKRLIVGKLGHGERNGVRHGIHSKKSYRTGGAAGRIASLSVTTRSTG